MRTRLWIMLSLIFLLAGCGETIPKDKANDKVEELTEQAFLLNENKNPFMQELSVETVEGIVFQMKEQNDSLMNVTETYGTINEGLTDDGTGKRVLCYKLPITFSFSGNESVVNDFFTFFRGVDSKFVVNEFEVEELESDYSVECIISFIGQSVSKDSNVKSNALTMVKNNGVVKEEEEVVLRDSEVNLTVRPSNSDAAAVALSTETGNAVYCDENKEISVKTTFYKEGNSYYCKYSVGEETQTDKITIADVIKFDILSCKRKIDEDKISVNLVIENQLSKKVDVVVYKDSDKRVKITKSGSVEVKNK